MCVSKCLDQNRLGLRSYFHPTSGPTDGFSSPRENRLIWQHSECARLGIASPRPKRGRGQPSRFNRLEIRAGSGSLTGHLVGSEILPALLVLDSRPNNNVHVTTSLFVSRSCRTRGIPPFPMYSTTTKTYIGKDDCGYGSFAGRGNIEYFYGYALAGVFRVSCVFLQGLADFLCFLVGSFVFGEVSCS